MQSSEPVDSALGRPPRARWAAMWVLLLLSLVGISGPWLVHPFFFGWGLAPVHLWRDLILALIYVPLTKAFYTSPLWFLLLWGGGLALCTLLWQISRRGQLAKAVALLPLGCLLVSPLAVVLKYGSFDTVEALRAHEGYEVDWLTEPEHALAGLVRRAQFRFTIGGCVVDLCEPELIGWDDRNRLFYMTHDHLADSYCSRTEGALWVYDPATDNRPQRIQGTAGRNRVCTICRCGTFSDKCGKINDERLGLLC